MDIKSIRLQNFKGFKDATLMLKPLTVLLGPNSSGKSCFGQALVALGKSNAKNEILNLAFDQYSTSEFGGSYSDLVHEGSEGELIRIELELSNATVNLGFGPANNPAEIKELELQSIKIGTPDHTVARRRAEPLSEDSISQTIKAAFSENNIDVYAFMKEFIRETKWEWRVTSGSPLERYNFKFRGIAIESISTVTGSAVNVDDIVPKLQFDNLASLLRGISYLRPDREPPLRERTIPLRGMPYVDDRGIGTDWFIHNNRDRSVETFFFPKPSPNKDETTTILKDYKKYEHEQKEMHLLDALTLWLEKLGLVSFIDIKLIGGGRATQSIATPIKQQNPRPLTDIGFGVSQVLPILVKGLSMKKKGDLLIVEQPEAQLHPQPQAVLADFFCAMVKCGQNVIVETHSEELFHRLRLRAAMDAYLNKNIGVYFFHESAEGGCCEPEPISLDEEAELKWPKGFLPDGIRAEMAIRAVRRAKTAKGYNVDATPS